MKLITLWSCNRLSKLCWWMETGSMECITVTQVSRVLSQPGQVRSFTIRRLRAGPLHVYSLWWRTTHLPWARFCKGRDAGAPTLPGLELRVVHGGSEGTDPCEACAHVRQGTATKHTETGDSTGLTKLVNPMQCNKLLISKEVNENPLEGCFTSLDKQVYL